MVRVAVLALVAVGVPAALTAQTPIRQRPTQAFSRQFSLSFAFGFHGTRQERIDTTSSGCVPSLPCTRSYGPAGGAHLSLRYVEPITRQLGIRLGADISAPSLRIDRDGSEFARLGNRSTAIRGEAILVFRFKPGVPVFFGAGGTYTWWNPGPTSIEAGTYQEAGAELGGILTIGYDAVIDGAWGARFEFMNYLMVPNSEGLPANDFSAKSIAHDWTLGVGVTYRLGQ